MAISLPLLDPDNDLEVYFRHFEIEDDDSLTFAFLQRFASDFLKHKIHVQKYLNKNVLFTSTPFEEIKTYLFSS